jgi:DNA-binding transcriptional ArsR family regulator
MAELTTVDDQAVIKALGHPLRVRILSELKDGAASPSELSSQLDERLGNVAYHVKTLEELGLVKLTRTAPRRGATEHWYELAALPVISERVWGDLPASLQDPVIGTVLDEIGRDLGRSAGDGGFGRKDAHLSRMPLTVDAEGFHAISEILEGALQAIHAAEAAALERISGGASAEAMGARAVLMLFETPQRNRSKSRA